MFSSEIVQIGRFTNKPGPGPGFKEARPGPGFSRASKARPGPGPGFEARSSTKTSTHVVRFEKGLGALETTKLDQFVHPHTVEIMSMSWR